MTETEPAAEATEEQPAATPGHCRHCGAPNDLEAGADPDFQCSTCGRWQDTMACPTCGQPMRISTADPSIVPAPHAPVRRRQPKEE